MVVVLVWYCYGRLLSWILYFVYMVLVLILVLCWYGVGMGSSWFNYILSLVLVLRRYDSCTVSVFL